MGSFGLSSCGLLPPCRCKAVAKVCRTKRTVKIFFVCIFSCIYLTANSNTPDADMADSIRGVLRRSRINRVMKIEVNDKKSVGSVKANMVVRINVIVSSF